MQQLHFNPFQLTTPGYLGHSSTLCFSQTVKNLLHASTTPSAAGTPTLEREDTSYHSPCPPICLDLAHIDLPPLDFAEYLATTVCFYAEPLYHLFDKAAFLVRLQLFYDARTKGTHEPPELWHIQMLLVFAFGKSVLAREQFAYGPAGSSYFARALEALPDIRRLNDEPILSIEIACLVTLFMHAADMLQEAYVYVCLPSPLSCVVRSADASGGCRLARPAACASCSS